MKLFFFACGGLAFFQAVGAVAGPVDRVVDLLRDLKARIKSDGEAEQLMYDTYACWCLKTSDRKAKAITKAQDDLKDLGQLIIKLKGKVATLMSGVADLMTKIKENEDAQEEATSIRQKENEQFLAESTEMKEVLKALGNALVVLKDGSFIQQGSRARASIAAVVDALPSAFMPKSKDVALLRKFAALRGGAKYTPQFASIQGILKEMYDTFSSDLESTTEAEAKKNKDFEELLAAKQKELGKMRDMVDKKEQEKSEAETSLAENTQTYDETEAQLKADAKFFDEMKKGCEDKHKEWTERSKLREQELEGITKALEILSSDEARELFAKSIKEGKETHVDASKDSGVDISFIQVAQGSEPVMRAYASVKAFATKTHSLRLAALAARIRTAKAGHFDEVISAIDKIIATLKKEAADDLKKRDQCLEQYQKIESTVKKTEWLIEKNEAKIGKLQALLKALQKEKDETLEAIKQVKEDIKAMKKTRKEENEAFVQAKKDDQDAIKLLVKARKFLKEYYAKNEIEFGKIQGGEGESLLQDPDFAVPKDQAPEADFSDKGSRKDGAKGIVSLMTMIIEDLNDEIKNGMTAEEKAQEAFDEALKTAEALQEELEKKVTTLDDQIGKKEEDLSDEKKDLGNNKADLQKELDYKKEIEPDCEFIINTFDNRAKKRTAEMEGLIEAKEFLSGASTNLLQKVNTSPSSDVLAHIQFLGMK